MQNYKAVYGQSLLDICLNTYGTTDLLYKLLQDNNIPGLDYPPVAAQVFVYDDNLVISQGTNQYFGPTNITYTTDINIKG